jgi:transcription elongation factor GreA
VADRLRGATGSEANLAQNSEYLDAREEKIQLEHRIGLLQRRLRSARVVEPCLGNGRVDVGERVRVRETTSKRSLEFELVGQLEGDLAAGRVSVASPLGQALVGLRKGEIAAVRAPRGRVGFEVVAVELPAGAAA